MQYDCIVWSNSTFGQLLTLYDDNESCTSVVPAATENTSSILTSFSIKIASPSSRFENFPKDQASKNKKDKIVKKTAFDQHFIISDFATSYSLASQNLTLPYLPASSNVVAGQETGSVEEVIKIFMQ